LKSYQKALAGLPWVDENGRCMSTTLPDSLATFPTTVLPTGWSLADVRKHLGGIPLSRIRSFPPPGMATEEDALEIHDQGGPLCELIDGILVEKDVGSHESMIAGWLIYLLHDYLRDHPLGIVLGADGCLRLKKGNMRMPDVSFLRWERFPDRVLPDDRVWRLAPDLAVEVLSPRNTKREMERKLKDLFESGTSVAWLIDPKKKQAEIYTQPTQPELVEAEQFLQADPVLPGFAVRLGELLERGQGQS
jgi:Uma2 family endonuclease